MILAILPARGRVAETVALIPRLLATAGDVSWRLIVVTDADPDLGSALRFDVPRHPNLALMHLRERLGYWRILSLVTRQAIAQGAQINYMCGLANDLLPGHDWLKRAHDVALAHSSRGGPLVAFNDGIRSDHAAHCLMSTWLAHRWYGDLYWPAMYDHLWADNELTERAKQEGRFVSAPYAVLYHNHFLTGQPMDAVYQLSHKHETADRLTYDRRRRNSWRD